MSVESSTTQIDSGASQLDSRKSERTQKSPFEIVLVSPEDFNVITPPLPLLQELAYARYTVDYRPIPVVATASSPLSTLYEKSKKSSTYVMAIGNAEPLLKPPTSDYLKLIESTLREYKNVAGFFRVDWGVYIPGQNLPNEALVLMRSHNWPTDVTTGYAGSFTPHPLLPYQTSLDMLDDMFVGLYDLAAREGFSNNIHAIFAPHVTSFVISSGAVVVKDGSAHELNRGDAYADSIFNRWPRYWEKNPNIYKIVPPELRQK